MVQVKTFITKERDTSLNVIQCEPLQKLLLHIGEQSSEKVGGVCFHRIKGVILETIQPVACWFIVDYRRL